VSGEGGGTEVIAGVGRPVASLVHAGRRYPITADEVTIGRGQDCEVILAFERVSRHHTRIAREGDGFVVVDLGSRHGTLLNGDAVGGDPRVLRSGDEIRVGEEVMRFLAGQETRMASRELPVLETQAVRFAGGRLTIGRDERNDLPLEHPNVSRFHAELVTQDGKVVVRDLGSRNGTWVDGELVEGAALIAAGSQISIGPYRLHFDGAELVARDDRGAMRLAAVGVSVSVGDKQILAPMDLALEPGEFVAVIGESGAGKSTLLKALAGVDRHSGGEITINGEPLASRMAEIGYVPQDDIVHRVLTVREALRYSARLRLPQDSSEEEIDAAVGRAVSELSLGEHADTLVGTLSGGQRKRAGVAAELLSRPSLLFLDEPTTGLDPGLETRMMELLRELADNARTIAVVTHATKNLALCDRVVVMARGGRLAFHGSPAEALAFFGVSDYDGIYAALHAAPPEEWAARFATERETEAPAAPGAERPTRQRRILPQTRVLAHRYARLMLRDRRNLILLVGQAPVLAALEGAVFKSGAFDQVGGSPGDSIQLLFLLVITSIWFGAIASAREIVKERSVFEREAAIGTRLSAYVLSKVTVLAALVTVQVLLYAAVLFAIQPLHASGSDYAWVIGLAAVTGWVGAAMGLLVSAVVTSEDQSMSVIPLALIPQLIFAGTIVPVARMTGAMKVVSATIFGQWSLAAVGTAVDLNGRMAQEPGQLTLRRFGAGFFDISVGAGLAIEGGFLALFLAAVSLLLRARTR
jgi:ABC-type multidrug transport system ATPase subunit/pSer/pThr/pTyr-binding forkhead associated (FHA) protein